MFWLQLMGSTRTSQHLMPPASGVIHAECGTWRKIFVVAGQIWCLRNAMRVVHWPAEVNRRSGPRCIFSLATCLQDLCSFPFGCIVSRREVLTNQLALRPCGPAFQLSFARGCTPGPLRRSRGAKGDAPLSLTLSGPSAGPEGAPPLWTPRAGSSFATPPAPPGVSRRARVIVPHSPKTPCSRRMPLRARLRTSPAPGEAVRTPPRTPPGRGSSSRCRGRPDRSSRSTYRDRAGRHPAAAASPSSQNHISPSLSSICVRL